MAAGRKTGGRRRGTPNKVTLAERTAMAASGLTPLEYMLRVLRDENQPMQTRLHAANCAAPYIHARLSSVDIGNKDDQPLKVEIVRFASAQ